MSSSEDIDVTIDNLHRECKSLLKEIKQEDCDRYIKLHQMVTELAQLPDTGLKKLIGFCEDDPVNAYIFQFLTALLFTREEMFAPLPDEGKELSSETTSSEVEEIVTSGVESLNI